MKRLTTDKPEDNVSTALNLFYVKDGWTWVRGGGPAPDYPDISLCDYIRKIAKEHGLSMAEGNDDEISMEMAEVLMEGTETIEGLVATLYAAGWAFSELRHRLATYEDTGLEPEEIKELCTDDVAEVAKVLRQMIQDGSIDHIQELAEAEKDGRLVCPPVKVGGVVWTNFAASGWYFKKKNRPYKAKVVYIGLNESEEMGGGLFNIAYGKMNAYMMQFSFAEIGKTVFLTKQEAEEALRK